MSQQTTTGVALDDNFILHSKLVSVQGLVPLLARTSVCPASGSAYNDWRHSWRQRRFAQQVGQRTTTDVALEENFSLPSKLVSVHRLAQFLTRTSVCPASGSACTTGAALDENFSLPSKWVNVQRLAPLLTIKSVCPASGSACND